MENSDMNVRFNLSSLIGHNTATIRIVCRKLDLILDNPDSYDLNDKIIKEIIDAVEELKESYRISIHLFAKRNEDHDFSAISKTSYIIRNQNKPNESGRTNNLDAQP
jgi:ABC-type branched-subunit amino acid transport system ATPase component